MTEYIYRAEGTPDPLDHFTPIKTIRSHCYNCGLEQEFPLPSSTEGLDKAEADYWKERYGYLMSQLNELIRYFEKNHRINPVMVKFVEEIKKIRAQYEK